MTKPRIALAIVSAAIVLVAGLGIYFVYAQNPSLQLTDVNFNVEYYGNFSNYLNPSLVNNTMTPVANIDQVPHNLYKSGESWYFQILITFGCNYSSTLYHDFSNNEYNMNNSVVIESVAVAGHSFSLTSWNYYGKSPLPISPISDISDLTFLTFKMNSSSYKGPLNITINAYSPAKNIVLSQPPINVKANNSTNNMGLISGLEPDFGLPAGINENGPLLIQLHQSV